MKYVSDKSHVYFSERKINLRTKTEVGWIAKQIGASLQSVHLVLYVTTYLYPQPWVRESSRLYRDSLGLLQTQAASSLCWSVWAEEPDPSGARPWNPRCSGSLTTAIKSTSYQTKSLVWYHPTHVHCRWRICTSPAPDARHDKEVSSLCWSVCAVTRKSIRHLRMT